MRGAFSAMARSVRSGLGESVTFQPTGSAAQILMASVTLAESADPFEEVQVKVRDASVTIAAADIEAPDGVLQGDVFIIRGETFEVDLTYNDGQGMIRCALRAIEAPAP